MGIIYCSQCSASSDVIDSRPTSEGYIKRRRKCTQCEHRWSTIEVMKNDWDVIIDLVGPNNKIAKMADKLEDIVWNLRSMRITEDDQS